MHSGLGDRKKSAGKRNAGTRSGRWQLLGFIQLPLKGRIGARCRWSGWLQRLKRRRHGSNWSITPELPGRKSIVRLSQHGAAVGRLRDLKAAASGTIESKTRTSYPGQRNNCAALTMAALAGLYGRPGTLNREIVRLTSGSIRGRCNRSGSVTEHSGMKANPIRASTIA